MKSIAAYAGESSSGRPVHESLLVEELNGNLFKLMASPGLVLGLAKGDVFRLEPNAKPMVVQRGGYVAIQIYKDEGAISRHSQIEEALLESLGASSLDGVTEKQMIFTVPASEGFSNIESVLNATISNSPGYSWFYGNVYDPVDGITPLNWWKSGETAGER